MPRRNFRAFVVLLTVTWTPGLLAQETAPVAGEQLDRAVYGPSYVEDMSAVYAREILMLPGEGRGRTNQVGEWVVPNRRGTIAARGQHAITNKWGDPRMGIGFRGLVDVHGAFFGQAAADDSTAPAVRVLGYREQKLVSETDWFEQIGAEPAYFAIDLKGVDRIEILAVPVVEGAGWYSLDDLTYTPTEGDRAGEIIVVDFEDLGFDTRLTNSGYAGLTWELGSGDFGGNEGVHPPMEPPGLQRDEFVPELVERSGERAIPPTLVSSFQGVIRGDAGQNSYPPDTCGAIGPDHFVEVVNTNFSVYLRSTSQRIVNTSLGAFLPGSSGDPRVLYDQHSGRWVVLSTNFSNRIFLAVSTTSDPTGSWFKGNFIVSDGVDAGRWPDYPTLGVDANGIYTSAYMVGGPGHSIFAIDKAPLIAASPSLGTITAFRNLPFEGAIQPAHTYGSAAGEHFVSAAGSPDIRIRRVNPPLTSPTLSSVGTINVGDYIEPLDAPALGSGTAVDTVGDRIMNAVYRDGYLWAAHTVRGPGNRAACRWYQLDVSPASLVQTGTVSSTALHYYFPGLSVNSIGSVVMGFSGSNSSQYIATYYTGRMAADPSGEMAPPQLYRAGTGSINLMDGFGRNRWGDYSLTTLDPADEVTFWTIQAYGHATNIWGTYVAELFVGDTDCDGNGIPDACDLTCGLAGGACDVPGCGQALDCNANGRPDVCDIADGLVPDCNGNGVPDECDVASGFSADCNSNNVPDECDLASGAGADCNENGVLDECDLYPPSYVEAADEAAAALIVCPGTVYSGSTAGASADGSASCGSSDGSPDVWYYYRPGGSGLTTFSLCNAGTDFDTVLSIHTGSPGTAGNQVACNDDGGGSCGTRSKIDMVVQNGTDYWIRIAGKSGATGNFQLTLINAPPCSYSSECNDNGIPDECEPDCNTNGTPDDCDIAAGTSLDANGNGVPDECEPGPALGDMNCDGQVNALDINPFVLAITNPGAYQAAHPACDINNADCNSDGQVNALDINPFVQLLVGG